ncbi:unnamed protein product [Zymoseptoria tritici ST99CH_1A5]|uniref:Uncharacterized protein n=1 Tax=Zymoseptoria tritici ST99CH_1A5 TaxID=1276529 RepID=A0A1Y6LSP1_ZYMTR|nr:unnamed protein product [Zymoseptoria tritici ST99CH_1A5]
MLNRPDAKDLSMEPPSTPPPQQDQSTSEKQQPNPETIFAELKVNLDTGQTLRNDLEALQQAHAKQRTLAELRTLTELGNDLSAAQDAHHQTGQTLKKAQMAYDLVGGSDRAGFEVVGAFVFGWLLGAFMI